MFQTMMLGALFVAIAAITDSIYAIGASSLAPALARTRGSRRIGRFLGGSTFIGLGVYTAFAGSRSAE